MKIRLCVLCLLSLLLTGPALGQQETGSTCIGPICLDMAEKAVVQHLGQPNTRSEIVMEGATGNYIQTWKFSDGLEIELAGEKQDDPDRKVYRINVESPCRQTGRDGLAIGMNRDRALEILKSMTNEGADFEADDDYASVFWTEKWIVLGVGFENGVVSSIFLGPGPE